MKTFLQGVGVALLGYFTPLVVLYIMALPVAITKGFGIYQSEVLLYLGVIFGIIGLIGGLIFFDSHQKKTNDT